ncbi:H-type small acid-soluble spore protein [Oceanobacillus senegalensis]|uniref:H-type small acid-soluble spore protein n=1 Tax=Oceanobacillus senegalensis TaxID=1936063 RepID=UPI000A30F403|nr:H-type small acid-soluble spore protein [Oceanobacillus senegalensis]
MDSKRAQDIIDSIAMINVNYFGIPVYIQEVHEQQGTATVFPLDDMDHEQKVDLNGLNEVNITNH